MARFQANLLNSTNALIALLISLLGFSSSCKKEEEQRYMYGTPTASFIVKGKVESAVTNTEIPEIIVEMRVGNIVGSTSQIRLAETGFSNVKGDYVLSDSSYPTLNDQTYQIKFKDTDGALNGEYETLDTTIVFKDPKFTGGDGEWFYGTVEKEVNIKLKPKK